MPGPYRGLPPRRHRQAPASASPVLIPVPQKTANKDPTSRRSGRSATSFPPRRSTAPGWMSACMRNQLRRSGRRRILPPARPHGVARQHGSERRTADTHPRRQRGLQEPGLRSFQHDLLSVATQDQPRSIFVSAARTSSRDSSANQNLRAGESACELSAGTLVTKRDMSVFRGCGRALLSWQRPFEMPRGDRCRRVRWPRFADGKTDGNRHGDGWAEAALQRGKKTSRRRSSGGPRVEVDTRIETRPQEGCTLGAAVDPCFKNPRRRPCDRGESERAGFSTEPGHKTAPPPMRAGRAHAAARWAARSIP
jgi:hypothetical protein